MINYVVLEGIVVKARNYADDLLFRLACFPPPWQLRRRFNTFQQDLREGIVLCQHE